MMLELARRGEDGQGTCQGYGRVMTTSAACRFLLSGRPCPAGSGGYLTAPWNLSLADVLPKWSPHCMPPP